MYDIELFWYLLFGIKLLWYSGDSGGVAWWSQGEDSCNTGIKGWRVLMCKKSGLYIWCSTYMGECSKRLTIILCINCFTRKVLAVFLVSIKKDAASQTVFIKVLNIIRVRRGNVSHAKQFMFSEITIWSPDVTHILTILTASWHLSFIVRSRFRL
jgi:hypothetical protein